MKIEGFRMKKCPLCGEEMVKKGLIRHEVKSTPRLYNTKSVYLYQCPRCKNIELVEEDE